jgi:hypothetical protein
MGMDGELAGNELYCESSSRVHYGKSIGVVLFSNWDLAPAG